MFSLRHEPTRQKCHCRCPAVRPGLGEARLDRTARASSNGRCHGTRGRDPRSFIAVCLARECQRAAGDGAVTCKTQRTAFDGPHTYSRPRSGTMPCRSPAGAATVRNSTQQASGGGSSARDGMIVSATRRAISGAGNAPRGSAAAFNRCASRPSHGRKGSSNWKCPTIANGNARCGASGRRRMTDGH